MTRCIGTWMVALAAALGLMGWSSMAMAQTVSNNGNVTNNFGQTAGVDVDANGVLRYRVYESAGGAVGMRRTTAAAAKAKLPGELAKSSEYRKISLNRLEKALAAAIESGKPVPAEMKYLAGLTRIENVFFYPETGDIVIAGPAEAFGADPSGRVIGLDSGAATIELQDLIVALRAFPASSRGGDTRIQCSIDPTQEGLARLKEVVAMATRNSRNVVANPGPYVQSMRDALGLQNVTVNGVSPQTHFAQVLVEADYRMKMIGIGLEVHKDLKLKSYVDRASGNGSNSLQRWWFVPNYECVKVTADGNGMELVGQGVKLIGESEYVSADGSRKGTGKVDAPSDGFAKNFTAEYPKIASRIPVYGQLKNVIDLSIAAAFIQAQDYYGKSGWTASLFNDESAYQVETYHSPRQVETAVNAVSKGPGKVVTPIGGGVDISPRQALKEDNRLSDEEGAVAKKAESITLGGLTENQWWWD